MVKDCQVFEIKKFNDERGFFSELYNQNTQNLNVKQINYSFSNKGTLRGIHCAPFWKLVTCVKGKILDVCVDLREDSTTYLSHVAVELSAENMKSIFIPENCGHAFLALEDSKVIYSQGDVYNPNKEKNFPYNDPSFNIKWPHMDKYLISKKDLNSSQIVSDQHIFHRFCDIV